MKAMVMWAVLALLVPLIGAAEAADSKPIVSDKERAVIESVVHDYLKDHPEVVLEALKSLEDKEREKRVDAAQKAIVTEQDKLRNDPSSFVAGNPKGDVTIVEFFDYNCGYCRHVAPTLQSLLADDKKIKLVLKEWPIRGADSLAVTKISLAAAKQPKFLAFHFALLASEGQVDPAAALAVARKSGLDMDRLQKDMAAMNNLEIVQRNDALAQKIGIEGTPAFVIGTTLVPGAISADKFKQLIAETRQNCKQASC